jgi:hypothetical protein
MTKQDQADSGDDRPAIEPTEQPGSERKRLRRLEETLETRPLSSWERYRALCDLLDSYVELAEIADRKTRFALIIMGALNTVNIVLVARPDFLSATLAANRFWLRSYVAVYAVFSLYLFMQAVQALRPRVSQVLGRADRVRASSARGPEGLRFAGDILERSPDDYSMAELDAAMQALEKDVEVRGVIVTGYGGALAAADIAELAALRTVGEAVHKCVRGHEVLARISALKKPVVAALDGPVLGGGAERARDGLPRAGRGAAADAGPAGGEPRDLDPAPLAVPETLPAVELGHHSLAIDKILVGVMRQGLVRPLAEGLQIEAEGFGECRRTVDYDIGMKNFIQNGPRGPAQFLNE